MSLALVKTAASYFIVKIKKKVASICVHEPLSAHGIYMKKKGVQTSGDSRQSWSMAA